MCPFIELQIPVTIGLYGAPVSWWDWRCLQVFSGLVKVRSDKSVLARLSPRVLCHQFPSDGTCCFFLCGIVLVCHPFVVYYSCAVWVHWFESWFLVHLDSRAACDHSGSGILRYLNNPDMNASCTWKISSGAVAIGRLDEGYVNSLEVFLIYTPVSTR